MSLIVIGVDDHLFLRFIFVFSNSLCIFKQCRIIVVVITSLTCIDQLIELTLEPLDTPFLPFKLFELVLGLLLLSTGR